MAGHSKWANIQHRKKAQDAKRAKVFTQIDSSYYCRCSKRREDPNPILGLELLFIKRLHKI